MPTNSSATLSGIEPRYMLKHATSHSNH